MMIFDKKHSKFSIFNCLLIFFHQYKMPKFKIAKWSTVEETYSAQFELVEHSRCSICCEFSSALLFFYNYLLRLFNARLQKV